MEGRLPQAPEWLTQLLAQLRQFDWEKYWRYGAMGGNIVSVLSHVRAEPWLNAEQIHTAMLPAPRSRNTSDS